MIYKTRFGTRLTDVVGAFTSLCLTFFTMNGAADCGDQLRHETIKQFRANPKYHEAAKGTYYFKAGHVYYAPLYSTQMLMTLLGNSASHIEIVRRTMGEARFNQVLKSADPKPAYDAVTRDMARQEELPAVVLDPDEIKAEIETLSDSAPLSARLEQNVFIMLSQMGRLATPMAIWAKPKAEVFQQLPKNLIEGPIEKQVRPGVYIYKAVEVTVLLNGLKTFVISAGQRGIPDRTHDLVRQALELIVPRARIRSAVARYIVVKPNASGGGHLEYVAKDEAMTVLQREDY